ncbi:MAG: ISAs1 family transposase [Anaeromyxobacter sp.]|nr:ISAs1 family transposase [Anaeromyxobacter sp.]
MALCGTLCGAEGWDELVDFCEARRRWLETFLDMPSGIPSADTFRRVFEKLDPAAFQERFTRFVSALARDLSGEVVAIDGKTLRGLVHKAGKATQLHLVHVWATSQKLLLAQQAVDGASGEMGAIPDLLALLDLEGAIITTDANSCTAPVTRAIIENKADYVLAVKGNRGRFYDHVVKAFAEATPTAGIRTQGRVEEGHGRKESRIVSVLEPGDWPWKTNKNGEWAGLRTAVRIERKRELLDGETQSEVHYYVSSLPPEVERIAKAIRAHWDIENGLHWLLDVAFDDDTRTVRNARSAENLAIVARMAFTLVKQDPTRKRGVAASRKKAGWNTDYLAHVLTSGRSIT